LEESAENKMNIQYFRISTLATLLTLLLNACVATSEAGNKLYTEEKFQKKTSRKSAVILDVRTPAEFDSAHIRNAVLLDYNSGAFDSGYLQLDKQKTYLVYCKSGKRSDQAATKMKQAGFKKVYQLEGGINNWKGETAKH
jgi:rhodanese-related sulfurtransferase